MKFPKQFRSLGLCSPKPPTAPTPTSGVAETVQNASKEADAARREIEEVERQFEQVRKERKEPPRHRIRERAAKCLPALEAVVSAESRWRDVRRRFRPQRLEADKGHGRGRGGGAREGSTARPGASRRRLMSPTSGASDEWLR